VGVPRPVYVYVYVYHVVYGSVQLFPELIYVHSLEQRNLTGCNELVQSGV
jgi:hypothetical protein